MKIIKQILFTAAAIFSVAVFAQNPIVVSVSPAPVSMDTQHSFVVIIPGAELKETKKNWLQYLAKGSEGDASETNGNNLQIGVVNGNVSATPFNVSSRMIETNEGVRLNAWLDPNIAATTPNSGRHLAMQKYVYDFAVQEYRVAVAKDIKEAENKLEELEKQLAAMIKNEEKLIKSVNTNDPANSRSDDAMLANNNDIKSSSEKISEQKDMVNYTAADANANKGAKKTLEEMKDDKKDLQNDNEKREKRIEKRNKENRASDRSTELSQEAQRAKTSEIEQQKAVIVALKAKFDKI